MDGQHTHGNGGGGALGLLALGVGAALVIAAATPFLLALIHALLVIVLVAAAVVVAGIGAAVVYLIRRPEPVKQLWQQRINARPVTYQPLPGEMWHQQRPAIGQPGQLHLHFHGTDPADVAEIIRRQQDGR